MRTVPLLLLLVLITITMSCGGGPAKPDPAQLTASITPSSATIAAGSTLALTGDGSGFTATPVGRWWMQEAKGSPTSLYCGVSNTDPVPSESDCPCGYIVFDAKNNNVPVHATYHAPQIPGTYHAVFMAVQFDGYEVLGTKTTTAAITVTP